MFRRRTVALAAALASIALSAPASALADCAGADLVPDAGSLGAAGQATLCLVNAERAAHGLPALGEESRLTNASAAFSRRMVAQQYFDHVAPDGSTLVQRLTAVGYIPDDVDWSVGENIAWGQSNLSTPRSIVAAWMASPGHRANILNGEYTYIGLGLATGSPVDAGWGATYTTDFGSVAPRSGDAADRGETTALTAPAARTQAASARATAARARA
ncbi:MAG: CAP domain-containing protein, partial [Actinomycetota bacterium]|nr:CAP domain-containing protein [Actinomycetota bacterium]